MDGAEIQKTYDVTMSMTSKTQMKMQERVDWKNAKTTHMLHIPRVATQSHEQDQWERSDNCFSEENRINLIQASQIPVASI